MYASYASIMHRSHISTSISKKSMALGGISNRTSSEQPVCNSQPRDYIKSNCYGGLGRFNHKKGDSRCRKGMVAEILIHSYFEGGAVGDVSFGEGIGDWHAHSTPCCWFDSIFLAVSGSICHRLYCVVIAAIWAKSVSLFNKLLEANGLIIFNNKRNIF